MKRPVGSEWWYPKNDIRWRVLPDNKIMCIGGKKEYDFMRGDIITQPSEFYGRGWVRVDFNKYLDAI